MEGLGLMSPWLPGLGPSGGDKGQDLATTRSIQRHGERTFAPFVRR